MRDTSNLLETLNARRLELEAVKPEPRLSGVHNQAVLMARWLLDVANDSAGLFTAYLKGDRAAFNRSIEKQNEDWSFAREHASKLKAALAHVATTQSALFGRLGLPLNLLNALASVVRPDFPNTTKESPRTSSTKSPSAPPNLIHEDLVDRERLNLFVQWFLRHDDHVREILSPSSQLLFGAGYRPTAGMPNDPASTAGESPGLSDWFISKMFLDLSGLHGADKTAFAGFVHYLNDVLDQAWATYMPIARMSGVALDHLVWDKDITKIPEPEREAFKKGFFTDKVIGAECRILGWVYRVLIPEPFQVAERYGSPESPSFAPLKSIYGYEWN